MSDNAGLVERLYALALKAVEDIGDDPNQEWVDCAAVDLFERAITPEAVIVIIERLQSSEARTLTAETWRPIETAPRDGTVFLAACWPGRAVVRVVRFTYPGDRFPVGAETALPLWPTEPTHWMPLPEPPRAEEGGQP